MASPRLIPAQLLLQTRALLASNPRLTLDELQERIGRSRRTIERYLSALRNLTTVHEGIADGKKVFWIESKDQLERAHLGRGALISLAVSRRLLDKYRGTGLPEYMDDALRSLDIFAEPNALEFIKKFDAKLVVVGQGPLRYDGREEDFDQVVSALVYQQALLFRLDYGPRSTRFDPYALVLHPDGIFLIGRDHADDALQTFDFARMRKIRRVRKLRFVVPPDFDARLLA